MVSEVEPYAMTTNGDHQPNACLAGSCPHSQYAARRSGEMPWDLRCGAPIGHRLWCVIWWALLVTSYAVCGCHGSADDPQPTAPPQGNFPERAAPNPIRLRLQLNWFPEVEHGGYYAAVVHGYFAEENLHVEILPGGTSTPVPQMVDSGRVELGITNADQILFARAAGARIVALFAALQQSPRCILVHRESGIRTWDQLENVTLAVGSGSAFFRYLAHRLPLKGVEIVSYSGNVAAFVANPRYAQQGYVFSEPFLAAKLGAHPVVLMVSDLGYNPYTSVLVTSETWLQQHPDVAERLVRACRRGWAKYLDDAALTNEQIVAANPELPRDVAQYGAEQLRRLCLPEGFSKEQLGQMTAERWQRLAEQMIEVDLIPSVDWQAAWYRGNNGQPSKQ